ncbi:homocysteine S-methyltransferase [Salinifilum aidingensis]
MNAVSLDSDPVVLDGGLATELETRGHDLRDPLWSARLLADAPDEIHAAHRAFFAAGARVATTASYQASFDGFAERGVDRRQTRALLHRSVELAAKAAEAVAEPCWVAASVGPYGAVLADGSEYRGRYGLTVRQLRDFHRPRVEALAEAGPDLLALETVPDVDEAEALLDAVADIGLPVWLSFSIAGEHTRAGQPLHDAFSVARGNDTVLAAGVNCSSPADVTGAVALAHRVSGKPVIAYPNSGEGWDAMRGQWTGPARWDPSTARDWYAEGARLIGGCCRVGTAEIAALSRVLHPGTSGA